MQKEHFEVVLEPIESKIQLILECFSVLDKKIDDNHDELKEDIGLVNVKISALSNRLDTVEDTLTKRIDAVDARLEKVETKLDKVETNLTKRIDAVHSELVAHRESVEQHKAPRRRVLKQPYGFGAINA